MPDSNLLQAILNDPRSSPEEKEQAQKELDALSGAEVASEVSEEPDRLSTDAREMLIRLRKRHLSEITDDEWGQYVQERNISWRDPVVKEVREWVPASENLLRLVGMSLLDWWKATLAHAINPRVRANAAAQIAKLEKA